MDQIKINRIIERRHRLPINLYQGQIEIFITCNILNKKHFFINRERFTEFENILLQSCKKHCCSIPVYLFMPDHCHFILRGDHDNSNVYNAIRLFKQITGYTLSKQYPEYQWQKGFWDHIIRSDEDAGRIIAYILNNPGTSHICEKWKDYPYKGSTIFDFSAWEDNLL